jgi:hypothetical protein
MTSQNIIHLRDSRISVGQQKNAMLHNDAGPSDWTVTAGTQIALQPLYTYSMLQNVPVQARKSS